MTSSQQKKYRRQQYNNNSYGAPLNGLRLKNEDSIPQAVNDIVLKQQTPKWNPPQNHYQPQSNTHPVSAPVSSQPHRQYYSNSYQAANRNHAKKSKNHHSSNYSN